MIQRLFFMLLFLIAFLFASFCTEKTPIVLDPDILDPVQPNVPEQPATFENLGPQIFVKIMRAGTFAKDQHGKDHVYSVMDGEPGHLVGFEVETGKLVIDQPIAESETSWDLTVSSDGYVYIAGAGKLYRHLPGSDIVENLGTALPGQTMIWALAAGPNGIIYGATWPGCRVFKYDPNTKKFTSVGGSSALVSGQAYAHSLVYHKATNKLYVGTGIPARIIELDPVTGTKKQVLPAEYQNYDFAYDLGITQGVSTGDRLFVWLTKDQEKRALIINPSNGVVEQSLPHKYFKAKSVITSPVNNTHAYFSDDVDLYAVDFSQPSIAPSKVSNFKGSLFAVQSSSEGYLRTFSFSFGATEIIDWKPDVGMIKNTMLNLPGQPTAIRALTFDSEGKIWSARNGAFGVYNPKDKSNVVYDGILPTMSMASLGDMVYSGGYPGGVIYAYDIKNRWNVNQGNPKLLATIEGQDRPFTGIAAKEIKKVYFGTVPGYGKNGGALVEHDQITNVTRTFASIIPDQSIVGLVYLNDSGLYSSGKLVGGTSTSGGLGIDPTQQEAKLFIWDIEKKEVVFETVPIPGTRIITGLVKENDNTVWGVADGTLFSFDLLSKTVKNQIKIHSISPTGHIWENANLAFHSSGDLYGTAGGKFFKVHKDSMELEVLSNEGKALIMDEKGHLYMTRETELWCYKPAM